MSSTYCVHTTEVERLHSLESENARLVTEIKALRREKEAHDHEYRERRHREEKQKKLRENEAGHFYLSPYTSPSSSFTTSTSTESYQLRITALEAKLDHTYQQAAAADQAREAAERKVCSISYRGLCCGF